MSKVINSIMFFNVYYLVVNSFNTVTELVHNEGLCEHTDETNNQTGYQDPANKS